MAEVPTITASQSNENLDSKKRLVLSTKVAKKIAINEAVKDLHRFKKHVTSTGEEFTTTDRVVPGNRT
jgi:hypothetical protein